MLVSQVWIGQRGIAVVDKIDGSWLNDELGGGVPLAAVEDVGLVRGVDASPAQHKANGYDAFYGTITVCASKDN
jgi:hypothetical protein